MAIDPALMSSARGDWETPADLYAELDQVYNFELDVCASDQNHKAPRWYTESEDGLTQPWRGRVWCNPPYGRTVKLWVARAIWAVQSQQTAPVAVLLLPARTDTQWFHTYLYQRPGVTVQFLKGRLTFVGAPSPAPFPSLLAVVSRL